MTHDSNLEPVHEPGATVTPMVEGKGRDDVESAMLALVRASRTLAEATEMIAEDSKRTVRMARQMAEAHAALVETSGPRPQPAPRQQIPAPAQAPLRPQAALDAPLRSPAPVEPAATVVTALSAIARPWAVAAGIGFALAVIGALVFDRVLGSRSQDVLMSAPPPAAPAPLRLPPQDQIPDRYLPQERR